METPDRKVGAGAAGAALGGIAAWLIGEAFGTTIEPSVAVLFSTLGSFVLGYFVPEPS
jgi:fluoride ion exporter CrcB/FEX